MLPKKAEVCIILGNVVIGLPKSLLFKALTFISPPRNCFHE